MSREHAIEVSRPSDLELVIRRTFHAPRARVFDALTRPDLLDRWYGPPGWSLAIEEMDLRAGGRWRFLVRRPDGRQFGMGGEYREVGPTKIVSTESYDIHPTWAPLLVTTELEERALDAARVTVLTTTMLHPTREIRDANWGAEHGAAESYPRLDALLAR